MRSFYKNFSFATLAAAMFVGVSSHAVEIQTYEISHRIQMGAPTKWDFTAIDSIRQRLFVTRGDHVDVVEIPSGKMVGTVLNTQGVHGVAIAQDLTLGFTSNGKSNSVTVFDLDSLKVKTEILLPGKNPDVIFYEPSLKRVFAFNGQSNDIDVIDATNFKLIDRVKASGRPEFAVSDGRGRIYFNIEDKAELNVLDVATNKVVAIWPLKGCVEPTGLAMDVKNSRLFSACSNGVLAVTDATTGKKIAQFAIGEHPDAVIFDPESRMILTSGGGGTGTLSIAYQDDPDHYTVRASLSTEKGAKTMAMNPSDKSVYLPTVVGDKFIILVAERKK